MLPIPRTYRKLGVRKLQNRKKRDKEDDYLRNINYLSRWIVADATTLGRASNI